MVCPDICCVLSDLFLGDSIFLEGSKLGNEIIHVSSVDAKFSEFRYDGDFIFYDRNEFWVELVTRHVELLC